MKSKNRIFKRLLSTLPILLLTLSVAAQEGENLVPNPSFENAKNGKVRRIGDITQAENWVSASGNRADLFSADAKMPEVLTPENIYGTEDPKSGINYGGIIAYSYREKENRTYLQSDLTSQLKKGMRYKVQFYVSLAELSKYSSNRIGAVFSKKPIGTDNKVPAIIMDKTDVEHPKKERVDGMYGWELICGEFVAEGKERYITIGNFSNETDIETERNRKPRNIKGKQIIAAYYYVDDVSVQLLGPDEECNCAYPDEAKTQTLTLYQRSPQITKEMTAAQSLEEYQIYFGIGRYDVRKDGEQTIEKLVSILKENPSLSIQITGHSDDLEAESPEDKVVSQRRVDWIKELIVKEGIDQKRLITKDALDTISSKYITDDDSDDLKAAKNRRVTFKAL